MTARVRAVTGAASGIGAAVTRTLRSRGDTVIALDRDVTGIPSSDPGIIPVQCDVTDDTQVAAALDLGIARVDAPFAGVVHCAGIYLKSPSESTDLSVWKRSLSVNLDGSFIVASIAGRRLLDSGLTGSIVLLSSTAAYLGDSAEPSAAYAASKGGVVSLTRQLAVEWGRHGIRTNAVVPGVIDTPMTTVVNIPDAYEQVLQAIPLGRLGTAQEVADVCVFLASDQASFVNGAVIPVDGGQIVN